MEYVYTTLLLHEAKQKINEESVKKVLTAASIHVNEGKVKALIASLADVNIDEAIKAAPVAAAPKEETKKEKIVEEPKVDESKAAAGLGSLFG